MTTHERNYIFISYSSNDSRFAQKLVSALENLGVDLWIDDQELRAGDSLLDRIQSAISRANFFLVLLSPNSVSSLWVQEELKFAITRQLKGEKRFVIPLLIERCDIPPFLQDRVYIDFTNRRKFKLSLSKLLHAIDELSERETLKQDTVSYPQATVLDKMAGDPSIADDEWFETYKDLPLVQDCTRALANGSFSGQFRQNFRIALAFASNQVGGINFNNLVATLGFAADVADLISQRKDLRSLYRQIVEDVAVGVDYRWFLLSFLLKSVGNIVDRNERLAVLPRLFPAAGLDPLGTRLVNEFFADKGNLFSQLWNVSSAHYRKRMVQYAIKVGKWKNAPRPTEKTFLRDNSRTALSTVLTKWEGLRSLEPNHGDLTLIADIFSNANTSPTIPKIVEVFERISAALDGENGNIFSVASPLWSHRLIEVRGQQFFYNLHVRLLASPYVDAVVATMCLISLVFECGVDSLRYHDAFPTCLMRKKEHGLFPGYSIIDGLVEQLSTDEDSFQALYVLAEAINYFPFDPFLASISIAIEESDKQNCTLQTLYKYIHGTVSRQALSKLINEKIQLHSQG